MLPTKKPKHKPRKRGSFKIEVRYHVESNVKNTVKTIRLLQFLMSFNLKMLKVTIIN